MIAALFFRGPPQCRSTQFCETLSSPPTNQRADGGSQSRTFSQGRDQSSNPAISPQKPSGSSLARFQSASYCSRLETWACSANPAGGGKTRVSCRTLSIDSPPCSDVIGAGSAVALGRKFIAWYEHDEADGLPSPPKEIHRRSSVVGLEGGKVWILRRPRARVNHLDALRTPRGRPRSRGVDLPWASDLLSSSSMSTLTRTRRGSQHDPRPDPLASAKEAGLRYVTDARPGIRRRR